MQQGVVAIAAVLIRTASQFTLGIVAAHELSTGEFGLFSIGTALLAIGVPLASAGMSNAALIVASRFRASSRRDTSEFADLRAVLWQAAVASMMSTLMVFAALFICFEVLFDASYGATLTVVAMLSTLLGLSPIEPLLFGVQGLGNILPKVLILHVWIPGFRLFVAVVGFALGWDLYSLGAAFLLTTLTLPIAAWMLLRRYEPAMLLVSRHDLWPRWGEIRQLLPISIPIMAIMGLTVALQHVDNIFVGALSDNHEAGLYGLSLRIALFLSVATLALTNLVNPKIAYHVSSANREELESTLNRSSGLYALLIAPLWVVMALEPTFIIELLVGVEYEGAAWPLRMLATGQLVFTTFNAFGWMLASSTFRTMDLLLLSVCLTVSVCANGYLDREWGALGASAANMTALTMLGALRVVVAIRVFALCGGPPLRMLGSLVVIICSVGFLVISGWGDCHRLLRLMTVEVGVVGLLIVVAGHDTRKWLVDFARGKLIRVTRS